MSGRCRFPTAGVAMALALSLLVACDREVVPGETTAIGDDAITVASFDFPESRVLAEIYAQALEGRGFRVERALGIGPRELVEPALERGLVELVPEYAGSALTFIGGSAASDEEVTHQQLVVALSTRGLTALSPAPAQDRNAFAVLASTADELGVHTLSDLVPHAGEIAFGGPTECEQRDLCLRGLAEVYGLHFKEFVPLGCGWPPHHPGAPGRHDRRGPAVHERSSDRRRRSGRAGGRSRDAAGRERHARGVTVHPSSGSVPGSRTRLNSVSALLRTSDLRQMNAALAAGRSPSAVARAWLLARGFAVSAG